jgi:dynein heavy chain
VKQRHSRATGKAITELVFTHDVTVYGALQEVVSVPETGVYVHGLWIEGAKWDGRNKRLASAYESHSAMPLIHFNPVVDDKKRAQGQRFQCPVYISADRVEGVTTSLVTKVGLPVDDEAAWVLSGVALLCSLTRMTETKSGL